jgi:hypothetical protein
MSAEGCDYRERDSALHFAVSLIRGCEDPETTIENYLLRCAALSPQTSLTSQ